MLATFKHQFPSSLFFKDLNNLLFQTYFESFYYYYYVISLLKILMYTYTVPNLDTSLSSLIIPVLQMKKLVYELGLDHRAALGLKSNHHPFNKWLSACNVSEQYDKNFCLHRAYIVVDITSYFIDYKYNFLLQPFSALGVAISLNVSSNCSFYATIGTPANLFQQMLGHSQSGLGLQRLPKYTKSILKSELL